MDGICDGGACEVFDMAKGSVRNSFVVPTSNPSPHTRSLSSARMKVITVRDRPYADIDGAL